MTPVSPTTSSTATPEEVIANSLGLVPRLRERIFTTEDLRKLPEDTIKDAEEAGIFTMLLPRALGGSGGDLPQAVQVMRNLAQGDPTAAWTLGFLMCHNYLLARWPEAAQREYFKDGEPAQMAGVANPPGRAVPVEGGYRVTGRWSYCSGVMHADWVSLIAVIEGEQVPQFFLVPRAEVEVLDTWNVSGMKGSGSHDVQVEDHFVAAHLTHSVAAEFSRNSPGAALYPETIYSYDARDLVMLIVPIVMLGGAEGVLAGYRERLDKRRAAFSPVLTGDTTAGQMRYAQATATLRAASALLDDMVRRLVETNAAGPDEISAEMRAMCELDCHTVARLTWEATQTVLQGSGSSIYRSSDITQHYVRDLQTLRGHATIDDDHILSKVGALMLGRTPEVAGRLVGQ
ncbi:acyl-CoA dehydrogenase family protein [Streptomyces sp. NBC_01089]|uniref:acyl-CoA dehydrogenase family protein n=1 Tax=Streptomyces sp. NBC_01089 TaxID=2903747 RepID=UPI00386C15BF|nr:acyl-CoA dehydrogenase family protein [Streptomyces sp. NBC_01089]